MKKTKPSPKLKLKLELVRILKRDDLTQIRGGDWTDIINSQVSLPGDQ